MEYVDLGLPSGNLWAKHLLGMNSDTDVENALYFQWGSEKGYRKDERFDFSREKYDYNKTEWNLFGDNVKLPSEVDFQELLDNTECKNETINGVEGMSFTSKTNSNYLFIPFIGYRYSDSAYSVGISVSLWSSSLYAHDPYFSVELFGGSYGYADIDYSGRYLGHAVLGIKTNNKESSDLNISEKVFVHNNLPDFTTEKSEKEKIITSKWLLEHGWKRGDGYCLDFVNENEERKIEAGLFRYDDLDSDIVIIRCWNILTGRCVEIEVGMHADNDYFTEEDIINACKCCGVKY